MYIIIYFIFFQKRFSIVYLENAIVNIPAAVSSYYIQSYSTCQHASFNMKTAFTAVTIRSISDEHYIKCSFKRSS